MNVEKKIKKKLIKKFGELGYKCYCIGYTAAEKGHKKASYQNFSKTLEAKLDADG